MIKSGPNNGRSKTSVVNMFTLMISYRKYLYLYTPTDSETPLEHTCKHVVRLLLLYVDQT